MIKYATLDQARANGVAPWQDEAQEHSNEHVMVFRDAYPVTAGHLLFVPRLNTEEGIVIAMGMALIHGRNMLLQSQCQGYNIGVNIGEAAGQTVFYPHVHLIPRQYGDCDDPTGGVRGVVPGQANYREPEYQKPLSK